MTYEYAGSICIRKTTKERLRSAKNIDEGWDRLLNRLMDYIEELEKKLGVD